MANDVIINVKLQDLASNELKKLQGNFSETQKSVITLGSAFAGLRAVTSILKDISNYAMDFVNVTAEFERLGVALKTVTGSSFEAQKALTWIKEFTATTPFQLQEVGDAFTRLKAIGIEDIPKQLKMIGDLSSAFGKDLSTGLDAFTGVLANRTVMLKQFGILVENQGNQMTFQWAENGKAMSKTINKTRDEIIQVMHEISSRFKGSMDNILSTFIGRVSNLKDIWDLFKEKVLKGDIFEGIKLSVKALSNTIESVLKNDALMGKITEFSKMFIGIGVSISTFFVTTFAGLADTVDIFLVGIKSIPNTMIQIKNVFVSTLKIIITELKKAFFEIMGFVHEIILFFFPKATQVLKNHEESIKRLVSISRTEFGKISTAFEEMGKPFENSGQYTKTLTTFFVELKSIFNDFLLMYNELDNAQKKLSDEDEKFFNRLEKQIRVGIAYDKFGLKVKSFVSSIEGAKKNINEIVSFQLLALNNIFHLSTIDKSFEKVKESVVKNFENISREITKQQEIVKNIMYNYASAFDFVNDALKKTFLERENLLKQFSEQMVRFIPTYGILGNLLTTKEDSNVKKAIRETTELGIAVKATEGMLKEFMLSYGMLGQTSEIVGEKIKETFNSMKNFAKDTAQAMNQFFSNFFFDALKGQFDNLSDYFDSFLDSMLRSISNALAQNVTESLIGDLLGNIGVSASSSGTKSTSYVQSSTGVKVSASVPKTSSMVANKTVPAPVTVNVQNNSASKVSVQDISFNMNEQIINVVVEDMSNGGRLSRLIRG